MGCPGGERGFDLVDAVINDLKSRGTTVLMATHQWERGSRMCDTALVLEAGRAIWYGPASDAMAYEPKGVGQASGLRPLATEGRPEARTTPVEGAR